MNEASKLLADVRACTLCKDLPLGPKPLLQHSPKARILIAGQAPGRITHERGIAFDDVSGDRLRDWMGVSKDQFYDAEAIAIVPMGFCFPGSGKSGDAPPRPECAPKWRKDLLGHLPNIDLTIILGKYAQDWHQAGNDGAKSKSVTARVQSWQQDLPLQICLPHPSPRNNRWLSKNPWFEAQVLPALKRRIETILT